MMYEPSKPPIGLRPYLIKATFEWILDGEMTPYLLIDASIPKVKVPESYVKDNRIILDISPKAVREFVIKSAHITFKTNFNKQIVFIHLPICSILAIYSKESGKGLHFPPAEGDHMLAPLLKESPVEAKKMLKKTEKSNLILLKFPQKNSEDQ